MHLCPGTVPKTYLEVKGPGAAATSMTSKTKCGKQRKRVEDVKLKKKKPGNTALVVDFFFVLLTSIANEPNCLSALVSCNLYKAPSHIRPYKNKRYVIHAIQ